MKKIKSSLVISGKLFIILILFFSACNLKAQTEQSDNVYEVEPGTKGNKIILELSNTSQTTGAENILVKLIKTSGQLKFNKEELTIGNVEKSKEAEAEFVFDINITAPANTKDTVVFQITSAGINLRKSFILEYTAPKQFALFQNYPNPFNPETTIRYSIPGTGTVPVSLKVYDILGREVTTLINKEQAAGNYELKFGGDNIASGVYIYRLTAGSYVSIKKMILLR